MQKSQQQQEQVFAEYEKTFKKGTIVEVSSEDSGLRGSWYTATVIRTLSKKTLKLLVEFHNLLDNSGSKPLREFVDGILVRPIPRLDPASRIFQVMEDVDAFHNDGWWEGVVTNVVVENQDQDSAAGCGAAAGGGVKRRYSVFFRCSREQIDFYATDLRLHREWVRGDVWVPPLEGGSGRQAASIGQKRKNREDGGDGRGGGHAGHREDGVVRYGQLRNGESRSTKRSPIKPIGVATSNGRGGAENNGVVTSKRRRVSRNDGLTSNGNLKNPRKNSKNPAGIR